MKANTKHIYITAAAVLLQCIVIVLLVALQKAIFPVLALPVRAVLAIVLQWLLLPVPLVCMRMAGIRLTNIGFTRERIPAQIGTGIALALVLSLFLTALPILLGFRDMVGTTNYTQAWQFAYTFLQMTLGVALAEEFFYRGFLFHMLLGITKSRHLTILLSSLLFGLSHILSGSLLQVFMTACLGALFCLCRERIKNCTTLSLIFVHGFHNALITLFIALL